MIIVRISTLNPLIRPSTNEILDFGQHAPQVRAGICRSIACVHHRHWWIPDNVIGTVFIVHCQRHHQRIRTHRDPNITRRYVRCCPKEGHRLVSLADGAIHPGEDDAAAAQARHRITQRSGRNRRDQQSSLRPQFVEELKGSIEDRLTALLELVGVTGATTVNAGNTESVKLMSYIKKHAGVYLIIAGTHVMGVSSCKGNYYFYDNESGLYRCYNKESLEAAIKKLREEWSLTGKYGWRGIKL